MRIRARLAIILVLALAVTACAAPNHGVVKSIEESHLLRWDHPTHGVPARVGFYVGKLVGNFVLSPFSFVEALISNRDFIHDDTGPFHYGSAYFAGGVAWLLGGPFYVLGLPFEPGEDATEQREDEGSGVDPEPKEAAE